MAKSLVLYESLLDQLLAEPLLALGFERAQRLIFQRKKVEVKQFLRFPTRLHNNIMTFNANAAVRFEQIEELLGNADPLSPTLMMPVHLLRPDREYCEWQFVPGVSVEIGSHVVAVCRQYLLPFIERMSALETLKSQLLYEIDHYATMVERRAELRSEAERTKFDVAIQGNGEFRLVLSPEQRVEKLAAIYVLEGRKEAAEYLIETEISKLKEGKQLPPQIAKRLRWEGLKKALIN